MVAWWTSLSLLMKVLWGVTLTASLIFIVQSIMTFIGADADIDTDFDSTGIDSMDGIDPGMNLYTFRNLVNFFLGFGWSAILLKDQIKSTVALLIVSIIVGVALVVAVMYLFKWLNGMQQSGTINVHTQAKGCEGTAYLTIPAERSGEGKVQITINGAVREYRAMTDGPQIKTGTPIRVIEALNDSTLLVDPLDSMII